MPQNKRKTKSPTIPIRSFLHNVSRRRGTAAGVKTVMSQVQAWIPGERRVPTRSSRRRSSSAAGSSSRGPGTSRRVGVEGSSCKTHRRGAVEATCLGRVLSSDGRSGALSSVTDKFDRTLRDGGRPCR